MKYVIVEFNGIETPILFPEHIGHADVIGHFSGESIVSAGFCSFEIVHLFGHKNNHYRIVPFVHGHSQSLGKSHRACDAGIIADFLNRKEVVA